MNIKKLYKASGKLGPRYIPSLIVIVGVVAIGVYFIVNSFAASPYVAVEANSGILSGSATVQSCASATNGKCVQFGKTLAVHVNGDELVNGQGQDIRLLGTDASGPEYCSFTHTVGDGNPLNSTEAEDIASWKMNAVRIPLNEDCWLGINGAYINTTVNGTNEELTGSAGAQAYQKGIENWVADLNNEGIITILDLHWTAPGDYLAQQQWPMADEDHSPAFWTSVATTFKSNPAIIFDLFNEPILGNSNTSTSTLPWTCWLNGCSVGFSGTTLRPVVPAVTYTSAGMQQLVNTVRATGATQPIILGGLNSASDPCGVNNKFGSTAACPQLAYMPTDPLNQLIVDYHNYSNGSATTTNYWYPHWETEINTLKAANIPVVTDEFGESDCNTSFMNMYMTWADENNESYLAWSWNPNTSTTPVCSAGNPSNYLLLSDWNGDPSTVIPQGADYKAHLAQVSPY